MSGTLIAALKATLAAHPELTLAILFGSAAGGRQRPESDVDLAVQSAAALDADARMRLIAELAVATGRAIDLVDLHTVGAPLLAQILRHGQRLLGSDEAHARLISRHLVDEADFLPLHRRILAERRRSWIGQ
jgi:predicted nucleotidyltransferase